METKWADKVLAACEASGKLDGAEIEYYVAGGLPPPHYRSDQLRLLVQGGRDMVEFATPNYDPKLAKGNAYALDIYAIAATPDDVRSVARSMRETGAFQAEAPDAGPSRVADTLRAELVVVAGGKEAKRVYAPGDPAIGELRETAEAMIARVKSQGAHRVKP